MRMAMEMYREKDKGVYGMELWVRLDAVGNWKLKTSSK